MTSARLGLFHASPVFLKNESGFFAKWMSPILPAEDNTRGGVSYWMGFLLFGSRLFGNACKELKLDCVGFECGSCFPPCCYESPSLAFSHWKAILLKEEQVELQLKFSVQFSLCMTCFHLKRILRRLYWEQKYCLPGPSYAWKLLLWQGALNCHFGSFTVTGIKATTGVLCGMRVEFTLAIKNSNGVRANHCKFRWLFWRYWGAWRPR